MPDGVCIYTREPFSIIKCHLWVEIAGTVRNNDRNGLKSLKRSVLMIFARVRDIQADVTFVRVFRCPMFFVNF